MTESTETDYWLLVAKQLIAEHNDVLTPDWYETTLAIWLRDGCRCVYCGFDLMADRRFAYHFSTLDHLLPKKKYPELEADLTNQVLACSSCNRMKLQWDPNEAKDVHSGAGPITDEQRRVLIERVIFRLREWSSNRNSRFEREKALITNVMAGAIT